MTAVQLDRLELTELLHRRLTESCERLREVCLRAVKPLTVGDDAHHYDKRALAIGPRLIDIAEFHRPMIAVPEPQVPAWSLRLGTGVGARPRSEWRSAARTAVTSRPRSASGRRLPLPTICRGLKAAPVSETAAGARIDRGFRGQRTRQLVS